MSKNQRCLKASGRLDSGISSFTPNSKRSFLLLLKSRQQLTCFHRSGRDRIRTCDPALIKRSSTKWLHAPEAFAVCRSLAGGAMGFEPQTFSCKATALSNELSPGSTLWQDPLVPIPVRESKQKRMCATVSNTLSSGRFASEV